MGVALDIDETLADTVVPFVEGLLKEFGPPPSDPHLSARELIAKYHLAQNVPGWESGRPISWIEEARSRADIHLQAPVIAGAVEAVLEIHHSIGIKCYATARHGTLDETTREWLAMHGFPIEGIPIISKPAEVSDEQANRYKVDRVQALYPDVTCMVDNSGGVVGSFASDYKGTLFFYGAAARADVRSDGVEVVVCPTWRDVAREISARLERISRTSEIARDAIRSQDERVGRRGPSIQP